MTNATDQLIQKTYREMGESRRAMTFDKGWAQDQRDAISQVISDLLRAKAALSRTARAGGDPMMTVFQAQTRLSEIAKRFAFKAVLEAEAERAS